MRLKRKLLRGSGLYLIIDRDTLKKPVLDIAVKLAKAGVDIIQLRDKHSSKAFVLKEAILLSKALKKTRAIFIVNDYPDIARLSDSDGLHIGQFDIALKEARRSLSALFREFEIVQNQRISPNKREHPTWYV